MIEKAYGKINLSINVLNNRLDGYHDLDMIVLPIALYDIIDIEIASEDSYQCNIDLPYDSNNLIYKAIELLRKEFNFTQHFSIKVTKNIPLEAGLAGGSTDAAATLRIINELLSLKLSYSQLACFAKEIGADVPFCIYQQAARVKGIGEIVIPFHLPKQYNVVLIKPQEGVNTKMAYQMLDLRKCAHPDIENVQKALVEGNDLSELIGNSLQQSSTLLVDQIQIIIDECKSMGYKNVLMSGAGSTVFVIDQQPLEQLYDAMKNKYDFVAKTSIVTM